jgi:hypothetical protein
MPGFELLGGEGVGPWAYMSETQPIQLTAWKGGFMTTKL